MKNFFKTFVAVLLVAFAFTAVACDPFKEYVPENGAKPSNVDVVKYNYGENEFEDNKEEANLLSAIE
ncbi:MAG: hypothetical protein MJ072_02210, partial [Clostridia bacterium]|nr:hypothetical protein [Clostridia bacterium]